MGTYLRKADPPHEQKDTNIKKTVAGILENIRERGESAVQELAEKFDNEA